MPRKEKKTKQEQEDEWRAAALELNRLGLLESKHPAFLKAFRTKHKVDDWTLDAELMLHADHVYNIISGVGSPAKLRTRFMDCMMPIPDFSFTNYSRMTKPENAGGLWLALGYDKIINDHSYYADAVKEAPGGGMYLQLPGMAMPEVEGSAYPHPYTEALLDYFHKHLRDGLREIPLVAIKCRLYMKQSGTSPLSGDWTSRADMIHALTGLKDDIEKVEARRAELCELCNELHVVLKDNLQAFDVEADNDSGSDSDEEAPTSRSKKQKTTCKNENVQKIQISTIEVIGAKGVNDPRHARRSDFKGETDAHVAELMMGLFLCDDDAYEAANKYLPMAQATRYSDGAELRVCGTQHAFAQPGDGVEGATIMTQRWATTHGKAKREKEMNMYLTAHNEAAEVRAMTRGLVTTLWSTFSLSLCFEGPKGELLCELRDPYLTLLEKKALFNVFMTNIWQPTEAAQEEEEEEESEEEESDQEDDEYDGEEGSDEEDVETSDDDDASDDDDDDEDASEGSDSDSDDD